jgi:hypothetical protein
VALDASNVFAWGLFAYSVTALSLSAGRALLPGARPYVAAFRGPELRSVALAAAKLNSWEEEELMRALCKRLWKLQEQQQQQKRKQVAGEEPEPEQQGTKVQQGLPFCDMAWAIAVLNMQTLAEEARRLAAAAAGCPKPAAVMSVEQLCQLAQVHMWLLDEVDGQGISGVRAGLTGRAAAGLAGVVAPESLRRCEDVWKQLQQEESKKQDVSWTQQQVYECLLRMQQQQQHRGFLQQQKSCKGKQERIVTSLDLSQKEQEQAEVPQSQHSLSKGISEQAEHQKKAQQHVLAINKVKQHALTPDGLMCMDILVELGDGTKVAVEVDGPDHFLVPCGKPTGGSCLRRRALARRGYVEISVPYLEWDRGAFAPNRESAAIVEGLQEDGSFEQMRLEWEEMYMWERIRQAVACNWNGS